MTERQELEITPEMIMEEVAQAAATHSAATQAFVSNFMFYGKTLSEWSDELAVPVPIEITPEVMRSLYIKLANNLQIASHFYSVASSINSTLTGGTQIKKNDLVAYLISQYESQDRRRPAATAIEQMAESYMKGTVSTNIASKIVKEFWRERRDTLIEVRKALEQISMSLATELKYLSHSAGEVSE